MYEYKAKITNVVDGDTVDAIVDLGFHINLTERFRLNGIDAPEMKLDTKEAGKAAKRRLEDLVLGREVLIRTFKDRREKYGRFLCDIYCDDLVVPLKSVNELLIEEGHAKPYNP